MIVHSKFNIVGDTLPTFGYAEIIEEPLLWDADYDFALSHGGPIVKAMIESLPDGIPREQMRFYVRVHQFTEGAYGGYPGWHDDGFAMNYGQQGKDGRQAHHYNVWVGDGVSKTEICDGMVTIPDETFELMGRPFWVAIDKIVQNHVDMKLVDVYTTEAGVINHYVTSNNFHRPVPATGIGSRCFIKMTLADGPADNEIKKNSMIYLVADETFHVQ